MSFCKLMINDFMYGYGRFYPDIYGTEEKVCVYNRYDLEFGLIYAEGLLEDGFKTEPFYKFNLKKFANWCKEKLKDESIK